MPELTDTLADRGFETVEDAGLPGGWATDDEWTVHVTTRATGLGGVDHQVRVYDAPPAEITIVATPAGRSFGSGHDLAIYDALQKAGYEEGDR